MCGILCEISCNDCNVEKNEEVIERIKNRGPNSFQVTNVSTEIGINASFCGSVLWMQGPQIIPQPVVNEHGVLLYNGDIFDESWDEGKSDTEGIMEKFSNSKDKQSQLEMINILKGLKGPFSIIYYNKENIVQYLETVVDETNCKLMLMKKIIEHPVIKETIRKVTELLDKSVEIRLRRQPKKCKICLPHNESICNHCSVAILFSGGLDCTILALIADKYIAKEQSIDLINVAFNKTDNISYEVPDRVTGKKSLTELKKLCPKRKWVFREVNKTKEELEKCQSAAIADLVYPRQTILDESLGSALWFAAQGQDTSNVSSSRVLLLGSGADELFGGYTRHRNAFKRRGWSGLTEELCLDWKRISFRNLARDNRVICDHGRQPRLPYLDDDFTEFVLQLKPWLKCFPSDKLGPGVGDKLMLRLVAFNLGLTEVALFPKRALQFGSRIANKNEKGSDLSKSFLK